MSNQLSASSVKRLLFVAAASVSALAFVPSAMAGDPTPNATNQPADNQDNAKKVLPALSLPDGFVAKDEGAAAGVASTFVQITQRAVTKDSYDSFFSSYLSDLAARDKARAQDFKGADQAHLNDLIGQIQAAWLTKYGQDFDVSEKNLAFESQFPIVQGEVSDPTTAAASTWPSIASAGQPVPASATADQQQCNAKELTMGRAVAILRIPAANTLPEIDVSFVHQALTGWYVALPADRTGAQIYNDLSNHLGYIAAQKDVWPSDVREAYRMVARNVAAALYGVPSPVGTASAQ